jgi:hypothetical protein
LRGLKAFRIEKIAKNFDLLDPLQIFAGFSHGLGRLHPSSTSSRNDRFCALPSAEWIKQNLESSRLPLNCLGRAVGLQCRQCPIPDEGFCLVQGVEASQNLGIWSRMNVAAEQMLQLQRFSIGRRMWRPL